MIIIPAIDIINGKAVRLYQGDYTKQQQVADSIIDTAVSFEKAGAKLIHIVDLDGAKSGVRSNAKTILEILDHVQIPIEVGGGIRTMEDIAFYIEKGVQRIILGTAAIQNQQLLRDAIQTYGERIVVGMDCKDGYAMGQGWLESSQLHYISFAKQLQQQGVKHMIFTDISKDGTLQGPNYEMLNHLKKETNLHIVASGGIKDITHIAKLSSMHLYGAIVGKSIYEGTLDLKQALQEYPSC